MLSRLWDPMDVDECLALHFKSFGVEEIPAIHAHGRELAENVSADRAHPPFDRVMMDGIALSYEAYAQGHRRFEEQEVRLAGMPAGELRSPYLCLSIMTGAPMALGADTIIPVEQLTMTEENGKRFFQIADSVVVKVGQHLHRQGVDFAQGQRLLTSGQKLDATHVALLCSLGRSQVRVAKLPRIALVSTGDELVPVEHAPLPHQIRSSNVWALGALLRHFLGPGLPPLTYRHFSDNPQAMALGLGRLATEVDIMILTGGVSMGQSDFVPSVMADLQYETLLHGVAQRPGKPLWVGKATRPGMASLVFGLPGNPSSCMVCTRRYLIPLLAKEAKNGAFATLEEDVEFKPDLTYLALVKARTELKGQKATVLPSHGSGDAMALATSSGFIELPRGRERYLRGESFAFFSWT